MPRRSLVDMGFATKEVSLTEVARRLGISPSTASRALRGVPGIRETTRQNVVRVAKELGYTPSERANHASQHYSVLTLSHGYGSSIDQDYLAGISRAAVELDVDLISHLYKPEQTENILDPKAQPRALSSGQASAIVLMHRWPTHIVAELSKKLPIVSIVHEYPEIGIDVITSNDRQGIGETFKSFVDKGYERIGFFGACREMSWARSRFAAFVEASEYHGLAFQPDDVVRVSVEEALCESVFENTPSLQTAFQKTKKGVRAWICSSQLTAASLLQHLVSKGVACPGQVAVAGYHGKSEPTMFGLPVLTTTFAASEEMGSAALRRVHHRIKNPNESFRVIELPCSFLQGTTG